MDIRKIKNLALMAAQGQLDINKAQVGSNGYGFVYFEFDDVSVDPIFGTGSGKICGAGAHFGNFERFTTIDNLRFDKLSDIEGLKKNIKQDLFLASSLKTLLPSLKFGGYEELFDALMFIITPDDLFFPINFYYGPSGTAFGGWGIDDYKIFSRECRELINYSPFDFDIDELTGLVEAHAFALNKVPKSDFCGIYGHDMGNTLMCVHEDVPFIQELGDDYKFGDVETALSNLGYDFKRDKFDFKRIVRETKSGLFR